MNNKDLLHTRYADLLDDNEMVDPALERLVADLETVYISTSHPAQLPELLVSTLEAHMQQNDTATVTQFPEQTQTYERSAYKRRLKSWQRGLTTIAAVLVTALITGSLLLVLQGARQSTQTGSAGQATSDLNRFLSIHMIDETTGWAQASDSLINALGILHTTDGGTHWQNVTPPQLKTVYNDNRGVLYTLDANTAWITDVFPLQSQPKNPYNVLFRTTDAGKTWQQMTLPSSTMSSYGAKLTFLNAKTGFFVSMGTVKQGSTEQPQDLWQTNDGGQTWSKVNVALPTVTSSSSSGQATNVGKEISANTPNLNNIAFVTEKTWWLLGLFSNNSPELYVTHDAGLTWQQEILPTLAQSFATGQWQMAKTENIQFFSANDGVFTLSSNEITYVTHDGGVTWTLNTLAFLLDANNYYTPASTVFTDINHGWIYEEVMPIAGKKLPTTNHLIITSDGGKHWTRINVQMPGGKSGQSVSLGGFSSMGGSSNPDFVSDKVGWLVGDYSPIASATNPSDLLTHTELFQTLDGGHTWHIVNYSVYQN
jgi:photosystem II stability/assembly factor-like uncharacterized protein